MRFRITSWIAVAVVLAAVGPLTLTRDQREPVPVASDTAAQLPVVQSPLRLVDDRIIIDGQSVYTCGHISCSYYMNRRATKSVADGVGRYQNATTTAFGFAFAAACGASGVGTMAITLCAGAGATAGSLAVDQFVAAGNQGECMRMYYYYVPDPFNAGDPFLPASPPILTPDNSGYCRNG